MTVERVPLDEAVQRVFDGEIRNASAVIGLLAAARAPGDRARAAPGRRGVATAGSLFGPSAPGSAPRRRGSSLRRRGAAGADRVPDEVVAVRRLSLLVSAVVAILFLAPATAQATPGPAHRHGVDQGLDHARLRRDAVRLLPGRLPGGLLGHRVRLDRQQPVPAAPGDRPRGVRAQPELRAHRRDDERARRADEVGGDGQGRVRHRAHGCQRSLRFDADHDGGLHRPVPHRARRLLRRGTGRSTGLRQLDPEPELPLQPVPDQ